MSKVSDLRSLPGDIVTVRGSSLPVFVSPVNLLIAKGWVDFGQLGLVISTIKGGWTYVLWSSHMLLGWCSDGSLRCIKQRG